MKKKRTTLAGFEAALPLSEPSSLPPALCWWRCWFFVSGLMWLVSIPIITNYTWLSRTHISGGVTHLHSCEDALRTFSRLSNLALPFSCLPSYGNRHSEFISEKKTKMCRECANKHTKVKVPCLGLCLLV